jgi:aminoglycoside phosphotransferase (APT) family kinase protein
LFDNDRATWNPSKGTSAILAPSHPKSFSAMAKQLPASSRHAVRVIQDAVRLLGDGWTFERELPGGSNGVALVRRPDGSFAVLRVASGASLGHERERVSHVRKLRAAGYPTPREDWPRLLADGTLASVTDFVHDVEPVAGLTEALVDDLVALIGLQAGLAADTPGWGEWLRRSLSEGFEDWSRPARLRADPRCAALADRAVACGEAAAALPEPDDLIHGDLHQGNLLVRAGRLVAVIDCGAVRSGDRRFDLVTALTIAAAGPTAIRQRLRAIVETTVPVPTLTVYVAHHGVRVLDWALTYARDQVQFWVAATAEEFDRYGV